MHNEIVITGSFFVTNGVCLVLWKKYDKIKFIISLSNTGGSGCMNVVLQELIFTAINAIIYMLPALFVLDIKRPRLYCGITFLVITFPAVFFRFITILPPYISSFLMMICVLAVFLLFSRSNWLLSILFYMFNFMIMLFSEFISAALVMFFFQINSTYTYELVLNNRLKFAACFYPVYILSESLFVLFWRKLSTGFLSKYRRYIFCGFLPVLLSQVGFLFLLTDLLQRNAPHSMLWYIKIFSSGILFAASQAGIFLLLRVQRKTILKQSRKDLSFRAMETQFHQFQQILEEEKRDAKFRHDLNNQLHTISVLYSTGDHTAALSHLQKLLHMTARPRRQPFCGNPTINALLSQKAAICEAEQVQLDAQVSLVPDFSMDEMILCSIFGNILDNAIQACRKCTPSSAPDIRLRVSCQAGFLLVNCDNPVPDSPAEEEHRSHWGLEILSDIAMQYQGRFDTYQENGRFYLELSVQSNKEALL